MATRYIEGFDPNSDITIAQALAALNGAVGPHQTPLIFDQDTGLVHYYDKVNAAARTLANLNQAQTFTNKTLTSPTLTNPAIASPTPVTDTSGTVVLAEATHANRTTVLSVAAGGTVTLPAATGSGNKYRIVIGLAITSVSWVISKTGDDTMFGGVFVNNTGDSPAATVDFYPAVAGDNTVTLAFSDGAAKKGDWIEFEDIAADVWAVNGLLQGELDPVTPFSTA